MIEEEKEMNPMQKVFLEIKECKDAICQPNIEVRLAALKRLKNISSELVSTQTTSFIGIALVLESAVVPHLCRIFERPDGSYTLSTEFDCDELTMRTEVD